MNTELIYAVHSVATSRPSSGECQWPYGGDERYSPEGECGQPALARVDELDLCRAHTPAVLAKNLRWWSTLAEAVRGAVA